MSASLPAVAAASSTPLRRAPAMSLSSRDGLPKRWNAGLLFIIGHVMPAWSTALIADDHAGTLLESQDHFVKFATRSGSGYDARFANKFGLLYAAGKLAVRHRVLPWAAEWPGIAAYRGYRNALLAAQGEAALTAKALARLLSAVKEPNRLLAIGEELGSRPPQLNDRHVEVTLKHKGEQVVGVLDAALVQLAGDRQIARSLIKLLETHRRILQGDKATRGPPKLADPFSSRARWSTNRRFWLFKAKALAALAKAMDSREQHSVESTVADFRSLVEIGVRIGCGCPVRSCHFPAGWSQRGHSTARIDRSRVTFSA